MGRVREINWFLSPYIRALYALPLIALVPIVILWVGYQPAARLVIVVISTFLPVAVTTADGTRAIAKDYLDVGQMFGARTHNVWFGIALPAALPLIIAGIELGLARGITNAIAVEVLASVNGMGMSVFTKSNELNEDASLGLCLVPGDFCGRRARGDEPLPPLADAVVSRLAHDPEKPVLDPDRGWEPVSRLREARFGGRRKVGKDHAPGKLMASFRHDGVEIAYLDEGEGDADRPGARLCLHQRSQLGQSGLGGDADARRPPRHRARQSRPRPIRPSSTTPPTITPP